MREEPLHDDVERFMRLLPSGSSTRPYLHLRMGRSGRAVLDVVDAQTVTFALGE